MNQLHITKDRLREFRECVLRMSPEQIVEVSGGIFTVKHIENTESLANPYTHIGYVLFLMEKGNLNGDWVATGKGDVVKSHNMSQSGSNSLMQAQANSSIFANCGECKLANAFVNIAERLEHEKDKRIEILTKMNEARAAEANWLMKQAEGKKKSN